MCVQPAQASLDANHASSKIIHPSHTDLILDILPKGSNEQSYYQARVEIPSQN